MDGNKRADDAGAKQPGPPPSKLQQLFEFSRLMFRKHRGKSMPADTVARMHQQLGMVWCIVQYCTNILKRFTTFATALVPLSEFGLEPPTEVCWLSL